MRDSLLSTEIVVAPKYSIVVPFHNEAENVTILYTRLIQVMEQTGDSFEIVLVDDGSRDCTYRRLEEIVAVDSRVLVVKLRRNFGQTSALAAGFDHASGEFILAMDGGLQHDPNDTGDLGLRAPQIVFRGNDAFEMTIKHAQDVLSLSGQDIAQNEFQEAFQDLSRRPQPDLTGAVHHAMAALEAVASDLCGKTGETLGQIAKHSGLFPAPLGEAVNKLYGFASDRGRHVSSGNVPSPNEAELVVSIAGAMITFLLC
jgi:hypothetical protein